ncbi:MAG: murein hydrolase activator EnvC family protein [Gammaproteobacteria bacterium]
MKISTILLAIFVAAATAYAQDSVDATRKLQAVQKEIRDLRDELAAAEGRAGELQTELARTETRLGRVKRSQQKTGRERDAKRAELTQLEAQHKKLIGGLDEQRKALIRQLRAAYAIGSQEKLKLWFNQRQPASVGRTLVYYDYFSTARGMKMKQTREAIAAAQKLGRELAARTTELGKVSGKLAAEQESLAATRNKRQRVLAALREETESAGQALSALEKDAQALQRLIEKLNEAALLEVPADSATGPFAQLKGRLAWPVANTPDARVGRQGGDLWQGVFISAAEGETVQAVASGRVVFADWMRGFGLLVIIDHGGGYMSLYGHNQSLYKDAGARVGGGEAIALIGSSGGQSRSGLYFEIRHNGEPLDPAQWCSGRNKLTKSGS